MKPLLYSLLIMLLLSGCYTTRQAYVEPPPPPPPPPPAALPSPYHSVETFYTELSPYGNWVDYPGYGYVWMPDGIPNFTPYNSGGYWAYTDYGYTWVSNYPWGWAPFHYGRWNFDPFYGWFWVPGNQWAPAWVQWGTYNNYYGWAPMPSNQYYGGYIAPANQWTFVDGNYINSNNWSNYQVNSNNTTIINNNITIINNYGNNNGKDDGRYPRGPRKEDVEQRTGRTIQPSKIQDSPKPDRDKAESGQVFMYRPSIDQKAAITTKPEKVKSLDQVKQERAVPSKQVGNDQVKPAEPIQTPPQNTNPVPKQEVQPEKGRVPNTPQPSNKPIYPPKQRHNQQANPRNNQKQNAPYARPSGPQENVKPGDNKEAQPQAPGTKNPRVKPGKKTTKPVPAKKAEDARTAPEKVDKTQDVKDVKTK